MAQRLATAPPATSTAAARTVAATKVYGRGQTEVRALDGVDHFTIPVLSLIVVAVIAALAGVAAAISPSRRASRLNILRAIVHQ